MGTRRTGEETIVPVPPLPEPDGLETGPGPRRPRPRSADSPSGAQIPPLPPYAAKDVEMSLAAMANGDNPRLPELFRWMEVHQHDIRTMADAKAFEYGSTDLQIMAGAMVQMFPGIEPAEALQAAIAFYALGKISRVISSFKEGRPAPADSWRDLEVYAMMAQRIMEQGGWP